MSATAAPVTITTVLRRLIWWPFCVLSTIVLIVSALLWATASEQTNRSDVFFVPTWMSGGSDWGITFLPRRRLYINSYCIPAGNIQRMRASTSRDSNVDHDSLVLGFAQYFLANPPVPPGTEIRSYRDFIFLGFESRYGSVVHPQFRVSATAISIPWWMIMVVSLPGTAGLAHVVHRRRYLRLNPTLCRTCGYDLRAGHDRCPECGAVSHVKAISESTSIPTV